MKTCATCRRVLPIGTSAWARDWTVLDMTGDHPAYRTETRYTCDDCEGD